ncbi:MAG: glycoside hydrolase family 16 protein [Aquiluna sp.]|nr:glycoside hydrolase family 16 protein [Aquiluna sp.]
MSDYIWNQEFDGPMGTALDQQYWTPEIGDGGSKGIPGWGNNEREYYIAEAAYFDGDGTLFIDATRLPVFSKDNPDGMITNENPYFCYYLTACEWTSARYVTENKLSFLYGRIEASIKMPSGVGTWPAFWLLGTDLPEVGWPKSGEIDIIEGLGRDPMTAYGTLHGPGYSAGQGFGRHVLQDDSLDSRFRNYAINWKPDYISWEIDGVIFHEATPADVAPNEWVFNKPHYMILNLAMGGGFAGNVDPKLESAQLAVEYIRYSQFEGFGELTENYRLQPDAE